MQRIHAYAASFGDDFACEPIREATDEGSIVLDPFVGTGTTTLTGPSSRDHRLWGSNQLFRPPLLGVGRRGEPVEAAVRALRVVLDPPVLDQHLRLHQAVELLNGQELVAQPAVERLHLWVLPRHAKLDVAAARTAEPARGSSNSLARLGRTRTSNCPSGGLAKGVRSPFMLPAPMNCGTRSKRRVTRRRTRRTRRTRREPRGPAPGRDGVGRESCTALPSSRMSSLADSAADPRSRVSPLALNAGEVVDDIPVRISYEIIKLFSEGLYQSPHKAVEELVANAYDAGAAHAWVFTARDEYLEDSLWVIDDGSGMDSHGFEVLWHVADPHKSIEPGTGVEGRVAIGQFGIGKLAAYVLAERLTHISKRDSRYLLTSMDFTRVSEHHQWESPGPIQVQLRELTEEGAMELLHEIADRDDEQACWSRLFGRTADTSWTAAALSEFKPLMDDFQVGTLGWVLRTGLPILSNFDIILNGVMLESPKVGLDPLATFSFGGEDEEVEKLKKAGISIEATADSVKIDGIPGVISGSATVYASPLEGGKSDRYSRSYGIFVKVRRRIINLEDETFGLPAQNHAAWNRTVISVEADGLREFLQSSREGVRETRETRVLQKYLHEKFLRCRRTYEAYLDKQLVGDEIHRLVAEGPSRFMTDPLIDAVRRGVIDQASQMFYLRRPAEGEATDLEAWIAGFETAAADEPISDIALAEAGRYAPVASYEPTTRVLHMNREHPFIAHLIQQSRGATPWKLFGASELLLEAIVRAIGVPNQEIEQLLRSRDRILRILLKDEPAVIGDVLGLLAVAGTDKTAMERATGAAFETLGFDYEKRGGGRGGTDGVLEAKLGVLPESGKRTSFKLVFDSKTSGGAVPNEKVRFDALHRFQNVEKADFAFTIADAFQGEGAVDSALNIEAENERVTVLTTSDLERLLRLHASFGVPLSTMRELFAGPYRGSAERDDGDPTGHFNRQDVLQWLDWLEIELDSAENRVPVRQLLEQLEAQKVDPFDPPRISRVRLLGSEFMNTSPHRLKAVLAGIQAVIGETYLLVDDDRVYLHQTVDEILNRYDESVESELQSSP